MKTKSKARKLLENLDSGPAGAPAAGPESKSLTILFQDGRGEVEFIVNVSNAKNSAEALKRAQHHVARETDTPFEMIQDAYNNKVLGAKDVWNI